MTAYLRTCYPEIPENFRAPVLNAATTAARQAAQFHYVWRDNYGSPDGHKRHYAASAASSLSFWALAFRSSRSGSAYASQESSAVTSRSSGVAGAAPPVSSAVTGEAAGIPEPSASTVRCLELPVPVDGDDPEFDQLMVYYQGQTQHLPLSPIVSLVESGVAPIVSTLSYEMSEVAPFTAARESALHPANLLVGASGSGVSEASAVQKQMSGSLQVQVGPGSDAGLAVAKETTAHTATSAAVRQDAVETRDAGDVTELEEPLVIHAPSDVEDSTSPVVKSEACSGGQKEAASGSQARGSVK